ncbi:acetoacetyl-CoA synthase [Geothermobacter hydrogeniphilus]|uniref:Acetoacetyl-CoA synthase n=1 Tax=Geothermobacter hydrogeniphilus TaxID=1969733 RepID=A0A2K2HBD0_9BACT|nr:type II toxin-antitoxin system CcdA family antitoxin [Geothermobacter hydrogeniphilus]PNU20533.1 acetoacetyl-CoA synthase [Geothermobacter hydrogeniphilus]
MKAQNVYRPEAPKRPVNLTVNEDLLRVAKQVGINLSRTFEEAVLVKVRKALEEQWREENKQAIASYNARIEKQGVFGARKRRF